MTDDKLYQLLVSKMNEVSMLPPQTVGPFTSLYKRVVPQFKHAPWKSAAIVSMISTVFLYLVFGSLVVKLASLLQYGF